MRILLTNHFPLAGSGSGVYTDNIANSLVNLGHEVCVVFPTNELETTPRRYQVCPVYFAKDDGTKPVPEALDFNFPCFTTHPKSVNTFKSLTEDQLDQYLAAFRKVFAEVKETFKPDLIHSGHVWILAALASELGIPLISTAHGTDLIGYEASTRYHDFAQRAADAAVAIVAISQKSYDKIAEVMPFAIEKSRLISNGYDESVFYHGDYNRAEVLAGFGIEREYKHVVSFAGKFTYFKGIDILLKAAAEYEDDDTATLIAGDGELFDDMNQLAADLGLTHVYFLHNQPHNLLRGIYNIADVSLVPSRGEAFGLVAIEAGACGAPIIGTNDGGMTDIIVDQTGILIDPESPEQLAAGVKSILSGERTYDHEVIAQYVKDHFSQDQFTKKMIEELYLPALS